MAFTPPAWFASIPWATQEDPLDPTSPFVEIRPGELDHATTALRRLWYQLQGQPEWERLMGVIGELAATLERGVGSVNEARWLSTAEGDVLDEIGALVDRRRQGLSDDQYRLAIRAEAGSIFASGTIPEIVELTRSLLGEDVRVVERFPGSIVISAPDVAVEVFLVLLEVLADVPAAGVGALLSTWDSAATGGWGSTTDPAETEITEPGTWSSTTGTDADSGRALWSTGQPIGGE